MKLSTGRSIMIIIILPTIKLTEACPLSKKKQNKKEVDYVCSRSVRNKNNIKRVSAQNSMIPAQVSRELTRSNPNKFLSVMFATTENQKSIMLY